MGPRERKRLDSQVRHFCHDLLQKDCELIVPRSNIAIFSQKDEIRLALGHLFDQRRLAEACPHDKLWCTGLSACDLRASSPDSWYGKNLLGQALKNARKITRLDSTTPPDDPAP